MLRHLVRDDRFETEDPSIFTKNLITGMSLSPVMNTLMALCLLIVVSVVPTSAESLGKHRSGVCPACPTTTAPKALMTIVIGVRRRSPMSTFPLGSAAQLLSRPVGGGGMSCSLSR